MKNILSIIFLFLALPSLVQSYPLDGYEYTGIKRLEYYRLVQEDQIRGSKRPAGGTLITEAVVPRWQGSSEVDMSISDTSYSKKIKAMLGRDKNLYSVALIDLSDPDNPVYAEHNPTYRNNVGSVGKLLVSLSIFQLLADLYPNDIAARERVLRETMIITDEFSKSDHHKVPIWHIEEERLERRALHIGDQGSLWEYLDWMMSASSNAAASMVMKQIILLSTFGKDYPVAKEVEEEFFKTVKHSDLGAIFAEAMDSAMHRNDIDTEWLRQGSFFTREGKRRVAGRQSYGNARELVKLLLRLESGKVVDEFSSREIKRLLYMTQRRIRYASHPALHPSAVYFKSGSLYSCMPEEGFVCKKYQGNKRNLLASVAVVETPGHNLEIQGPDLHYLVVVHSNVLRVNSAVAHQTLALRIHRMIEAAHKERLAADPDTQ